MLSETQRTELVARAIGIVEGAVLRILTTDDRLRGVEMKDGRVIPRTALFVPPRFVPNNDLLVTLAADLDENGWVRTDSTGATSVPGVWVAGNLANPRAQVITAAGEGSAAAIAMNAVLVDDDVRRRRPGPPPRRAGCRCDRRVRTAPRQQHHLPAPHHPIETRRTMSDVNATRVPSARRPSTSSPS